MGWIGRIWELIFRSARRLVVLVVGFVVVAVGIILLPLPGPGWLVIFAGLAILSTEFTWAERLMRWVEKHAVRATRLAVHRIGFLQRLPYLRRFAPILERELTEPHDGESSGERHDDEDDEWPDDQRSAAGVSS